MDAMIRFCFLVDPENIETEEEYAKLYCQAKWIIDYTSLLEAKKQAQLHANG